jgi:hypothetical protein
MKALRRFCAAAVLTLTLALPASAGWISTTATQPPPPPPGSMTAQGQAETSGADVGSTAESGEATASDSLAEVALNLLNSVLALL